MKNCRILKKFHSNITHVEKCIDIICSDNSVSATRTVVETENRLYEIEDDVLLPQFEDYGRSMIRRQEMGSSYKVFSTDVFRFSKDNLHDSFLGNNVRGVVTNKICGLDIDDNDDFEIANAIFGLVGKIL